jgi:hypothetical protein
VTTTKPPAVNVSAKGKTPPGAGKAANCYTVDAAGIWHIKPECL